MTFRMYTIPRRWAGALGLSAALAAGAAPAAAQTDYYNTDARRPVRIEDAYPVERYAFEAQVAPLRLERMDGGAYQLEVEPELAYGVFARTHVEVGLPLVFADGGAGGEEFGLGGVDVSLFHNLNVETRTLPALAVAVDALLPVGNFAPDRVHPSVTGIATRTFRLARVHLNGQYTLGPAPEGDLGVDVDAGETSRWMAGVAVDRAFPLRSLLLIADVFVEQPLRDDERPQWTSEAGIRYQLDPYFALDAGVGRKFAGEERAWFVTFGAARVFALRSLMPIR